MLQEINELYEQRIDAIYFETSETPGLGFQAKRTQEGFLNLHFAHDVFQKEARGSVEYLLAGLLTNQAVAQMDRSVRPEDSMRTADIRNVDTLGDTGMQI